MHSECRSQRRSRGCRWMKKKKRKQTPRSQVPRASEKVHDGQVWLLQERRRLLGRRPGKKGRGLSRCIGRRASKLARPGQLVRRFSAAHNWRALLRAARWEYSLVAKSLASLSMVYHAPEPTNLYNAAFVSARRQNNISGRPRPSGRLPWTPLLPHMYPSIT
jgi:hypothetical protein